MLAPPPKTACTLLCWTALAAATLTGCGGGPTEHTVSGTVTYQGKPVEQGEIFFADPAATAPTARATIENGHYEIRCLAGEKKVRITASRETGKMIEGAMGASYPETIDLIPPKYNTATTLQCKVGPGEDANRDFNLE